MTTVSICATPDPPSTLDDDVPLADFYKLSLDSPSALHFPLKYDDYLADKRFEIWKAIEPYVDAYDISILHRLSDTLVVYDRSGNEPYKDVLTRLIVASLSYYERALFRSRAFGPHFGNVRWHAQVWNPIYEVVWDFTGFRCHTRSSAAEWTRARTFLGEGPCTTPDWLEGV